LALRPAVRLAHYLGFASSMGKGLVDYTIADSTVIPSRSSKHFGEKIIRMDGCFFPPGDFNSFAKKAQRKEAGLPTKGFIYCAFHAAYKIEPQIWGCWMRILKSVPGSILWLKFKPTDDAIQNLRAEAVRQGVSSKRIILAEDLPEREVHLSRMAAADLYLDCPLYNGHASAMDALHAKLPILTIKGHRFCNRVGESFCKNLGLKEMVVTDLKAYEKKAIELGLDQSLLKPLRKKLELNADAVLSPTNHAKRFEHAIDKIIKKVVKQNSITSLRLKKQTKAQPQDLKDFTLLMIRPVGISNWAQNVSMLADELQHYGGTTMVIDFTNQKTRKSDFSKSVNLLNSPYQTQSDSLNHAFSELKSKYLFYLDDPLRVLPASHFIQAIQEAKHSLTKNPTGILGICSSREPHTGCLTTISEEKNKKPSGLFCPSFILNLEALQRTGGLRKFGHSLPLSLLDLSIRFGQAGYRSSLLETNTISCQNDISANQQFNLEQDEVNMFKVSWRKKPIFIENINIFRKSLPKQIINGKSVGVFITIFYHSQVNEIFLYLSRLKFTCNIYISSNLNLISLKYRIEDLGHHVFLTESLDYGMDIADFILQLKKIKEKLIKHDYYLKIHSKRDDKWRRSLLNNLLPIKGYEKIFDILDEQNFLAVDKYFYPIQFLLVNKELIESNIKRSGIKIPNLFASPEDNKFFIQDYYNYNYDLKNLTRSLKNRCKDVLFEKQLLEHYEKTKAVESSRIVGKVKSLGDPKYKFSAGSMFWFSNDYLEYFLKHSESFDKMLIEMSKEKGKIINNIPRYTHFLENWFGVLACHNYKKQIKSLRTITFLLPYLSDSSASSGGFRTLLIHIDHLLKNDFFVNLQFCGPTDINTQNKQLRYIASYKIIDDIKNLNISIEENDLFSDVFIATGWQTFNKARYYENMGENLCFFCQDLEYLFDAVKLSNNSGLISSVKSFYKEPRPTFTVTKFLGNKIRKFHKGKVFDNTMFVENRIYKILSNPKDRSGICMLFSSSKSHRLPNLSIELSHKIVHNFPNEPVFIFGDISEKDKRRFPNTVNILGTLCTRKLSELYNKCKLGTCFSTTNPSRIGFEMSACGCHCIEIDCEYTKQDLSSDLFTKCLPDVESIYSSIHTILVDIVEYKKKYSKCVSYSSKLKFQNSEQKNFHNFIHEIFYK